MGLDYKYTCPIIDRNIGYIKSDIESYISSLLNGLDLADEKIEELSNSLYSKIESYIEDIRNTNSDMRDKADEQIDNLENNIENLKADIAELENRISELE